MTELIDLHAHPSLKMHYLPYVGKSFHARVPGGPFWNPLSFRTQYANLSRAPLRVMMATHYVIEQGFVRHGLRPRARRIAHWLAPRFYRKLCQADSWQTLLTMMDSLEESVAQTNRRVPKGGRKLRLIRSLAELGQLPADDIALIHAVEGAHALGYGLVPGQDRESFWAQTVARLEILQRRGVCMIGLAHFWDNMFSPQTNGTEIICRKTGAQEQIRPDDELVQMRRATWRWDDDGMLAEPLVRQLLRMGILIDVAHSQPHARRAIYDLCRAEGRPLVASHVGLQHFFAHEYNLADEEILQFHQLGGVLGLILSRRWLASPHDRYHSIGDGFSDLINSILHIKKITGDVSCIGIGTDFDGLIRPINGCRDPSQLPTLAHRLAEHFSAQEIQKIFYDNAYRVLQKGWAGAAS